MDVAITGIDCRFPGAPDRDAFWQLLVRGGDGVGPVPSDRWDAAAYHSAGGEAGTTNTREGGFIADPDAFDNELFGITPGDAAAMDPQQRLLLQSAWRGLEDAGIDPKSLERSATGVFVGVMGSEWAHLKLADYTAITPQLGAGNGYCMTANRISYHLGLNGPSLAVDTACSSSLVAVHLACQSLRAGECDLAIAAGVNLILTPVLNIFYSQAGLSAPDGRCKPFGAESNGIGRAEGVGVVVLRRLDDALADGDRPFAVIRGSAVNHDGRSNGLTAPSRWAQTAVIERAYAAAGVEPAGVDFVEAHGTGTVLGDMIEVKALGGVHGTERERPCAIGSVKGNIGHAEGAAGIAGLIKAALSLHHRVLPPTRHGVRESPQLRLARHGLDLATDLIPLRGDETVGAVSSFGLGGTNAHVVLASVPSAPAHAPPADAPGVLTLSGNDLEALRRNAAACATLLRDRPEVSLTDACRASNRVKASLPWRLAVGGDSRAELLRVLEEVGADDAAAERLARRPDRQPRIGFLLTGQGSQRPGMTRALAAASPAYRSHLDAADRALADHVGRSIVELLLSDAAEIRETRFAQPAIFAVQYALGRTLAELGVRPQVMVGHSIGELAGACLAGVLTLPDAARLVAARGALMQALPDGGGMLAVRAEADELLDLLDGRPTVAVAARNAPRSVTLSGDLGELAAVGTTLKERGLTAVALDVSHAFHSPLMAPMVPDFHALAAGVSPAAGDVRIVSTVTAAPIAGEAMDAAYWSEHVSAPVRFADAVAVAAADVTHFVELGPRPVLTGLVADNPATAGVSCLSATSVGGSATDLARLVAALYADGLAPHWEALYEGGRGAPARLHPYAFSTRNRFWVGAPRAVAPPTAARPAAPAGDGSSVRDAVRNAIAAVTGHDTARVVGDARLQEDLGFDSVMLMMLKRELEQRIPGVEQIEVEALVPHVETVDHLTRWLEQTGAVRAAEVA